MRSTFDAREGSFKVISLELFCRENNTNMKKQTAFTRKDEKGFGIWSAIVLLALIAFIAAVILKAMGVWTALIGFVLVTFVAILLASLPDIIRYNKMSGM